MKHLTLLFLVLASLLCGCGSLSQPASPQLQTETALLQVPPPGICSTFGPDGFEPLPGGGVVLVEAEGHTVAGPMEAGCVADVYHYEARILFASASFGTSPLVRATLSFQLLSSYHWE